MSFHERTIFLWNTLAFSAPCTTQNGNLNRDSKKELRYRHRMRLQSHFFLASAFFLFMTPTLSAFAETLHLRSLMSRVECELGRCELKLEEWKPIEIEMRKSNSGGSAEVWMGTWEREYTGNGFSVIGQIDVVKFVYPDRSHFAFTGRISRSTDSKDQSSVAVITKTAEDLSLIQLTGREILDGNRSITPYLHFAGDAAP